MLGRVACSRVHTARSGNGLLIPPFDAGAEDDSAFREGVQSGNSLATTRVALGTIKKPVPIRGVEVPDQGIGQDGLLSSAGSACAPMLRKATTNFVGPISVRLIVSYRVDDVQHGTPPSPG
jgi:hypothetical protein